MNEKLSTEMILFLSNRNVNSSTGRIEHNVFQARAVPVVRKVKCTNVQRNAKMQNEQAWILLGVMPAFFNQLFRPSFGKLILSWKSLRKCQILDL